MIIMEALRQLLYRWNDNFVQQVKCDNIKTTKRFTKWSAHANATLLFIPYLIINLTSVLLVIFIPILPIAINHEVVY